MKIHVINQDAEAIGGYTKVPVVDETIQFGDISNNECEFIMANQVLNNFPADKVGACLQALISKLRMG